MVFSSMVFLCAFLPLTFLGSRLTRSIRAQNWLLIAASLIFYAYGEPEYILLMLASSLVNWIFGLLMKDGPKKWVVTLAVLFNISLLFVFKYLDLAIVSANALFNGEWKPVGLPLPVGISFFSFQALSYVIDVYRQEVPAQKHFSRVLLYISLFPQLIAGPIVKYHDIEKEIGDRTITSENTASGLRRFCVGLAKKVLIANTMAQCADGLFALDPHSLNVLSAWIAAISYLFQIYFDFSGYSDMAIGLGEIFGFHFRENFNYPYISHSIQEFWRRWHISLSTWFKQYLYIPLGGNRKGKIRTAINKIIVFLATGIWHGANFTFVFWGLWHGFFILFEDAAGLKKLPRFLQWFLTMLVVTIGFVMFRADTVAQGLIIISKMFTGFQFSMPYMAPGLAELSPVFLCALLAAAIGSTPLFKKIDWNRKGMLGFSFAGSYLLLVICLLMLSAGTYNPFIYFRF